MRCEGKVTWFNEQKGFGFIVDENGQDFFVHYTEIMREGFQTLEPGERVTFGCIDEENGPKAVEVRLKNDISPSMFL
ncbi:cold shock domain-containing protein [Pseudodesulfovibrio sp. JC047]|uniref:cold-shock protein n=1 Tax=Pseudodesulfovibrio sp. JC047 TaxID=2683199 RepID=UPI0031BA50D8